MANIFKAKTLVSRTGIFSHEVIAPNLVYNTGNQTISGIKTFAENTVFGDPSQGDFLVISGNTFTIYGSGNFTSGLFVNGNPVLTGVDLSSYATIANLALTGSTLDTKINNLSGVSVLTFGDQNISGNKNFLNNISVSGTGFFNAIDLNNIDTLSLSGVNISIVDGAISLTNRPNVNGTGVVLSGELNSTGIFLNNKINSLSGYVNSQDIIFSGQTFNTGSRLDNKINSLSGVSVLTFGNQNISGIKTFVDTGVFGASNFNYIPLTSNPLSVIGSGNTFVQLNIQNLAIGNAASSDLVLASNAGTDDSFYIDLGINNSGYNQAAYNIGSSGDGYLYVHGGNLTIGTQSPNRIIKFHTNGTTSVNQIAEINSTGYFSPNKAVIALTGFFGRNNTYIGTDITMGGGQSNRISGNISVINGGLYNRITGDLSNIHGGCFNVIRGNRNTIGGGENNQIGVRNLTDVAYIPTTLFNFIGGGSGNSIPPHHCSNVIVGGTNNVVASAVLPFIVSHNNSILGGENNMVGANTARHSSILGGCCNTVTTCGSTIVGGCCNGLFVNNSIVAYGLNNSGISIVPGVSTVFLGGVRNRIDASSVSVILGGCDNKIYGNCSSIIGGHSNTLGSWSTREGTASFIGGGGFNIITGTQAGCSTTSEYSLIVGGYANKVTSCYASILGGRQNLVTHVGATVIGDGGARDKISRGVCSLSLDFNGGIFLTGSNITLSPSPLPGRVDFCDSNLVNATPNILNVNTNFSIGAGYNSRVVLANSGSMLTGTINLGNPTGFNTSIIQIGAGQVQITGSAGVIINSYNNQFKTAAQYATISLLHSGNNGYIMYGNTSL